MDKILVKALAKINLTLDVLGVRKDGYHEVKMIMQSVSLFDEITVSQNNCDDISLSCNLKYIPLDDRNSAYKAARLFFDEAGIKKHGVLISLNKRVPAQAGLAGGSADAAGTLVALNELYKTGFDIERLCAIALKIGADVPFCIKGGTMLACGLGEILSPLPEMPDCSIVIARPSRGASTPEIYKRYDKAENVIHPDTDGFVEALGKGDLRLMSSKLCNVLEPVTAGIVPDVFDIKGKMLKCGADGALMTGSGTAVFGIFTDKEKARYCLKGLKASYNFACIAAPYDKGAEIF